MSSVDELEDTNVDSLFFMVEEGQISQGDFCQARRMIGIAAGTGADAIEFQLAFADDFYVSTHPGYALYKRREFSDQQLKDLVTETREAGLQLVVTPLSERIVTKMANFGCSRFTINASDVNNPSILHAVADSGLPFHLSIALATEDEVRYAVELINHYRPSSGFSLLHGQHTMASGKCGVRPEDSCLGYLRTLRQEYERPVGFVDHTPFEWFPACAVAAGATTVTKHLAPDHESRGPDWQICLDPMEMKRAIAGARKVFQSIRKEKKTLVPEEYTDRMEMRRSIVANRDMDAGHRIQSGDIAFKRPGIGMAPTEMHRVLGSVLLMGAKKDDLIRPEMLEGV